MTSNVYKTSGQTQWTLMTCVFVLFMFVLYIYMTREITAIVTLIKPTKARRVTNNYFPALRCNSTPISLENVKKDEFQKIGSAKSSLVFSAYHDVDEPNFVRVIAVCYKHTVLPYYCHVWYNESGHMSMIITNTTFWYITEEIVEFNPCNITCLLPVKRTPVAVSVMLDQNCTTANNVLKIEHIGTKRYTRNFTMCLSALHSKYDDARKLVEWIEFNKILGANHFLIYELSTGKNAKRVLNYYMTKGLVEIIQWPILKHVHNAIGSHYFVQASAYNDCLLRIKSHSKFVVVSDLDEFVVPHKEGVSTWIELLEHLPKVDSYLFRNCYFPSSRGYSNINYPEKAKAKNYSIISLLALKRSKEIMPVPFRTNYIARTATTDCIVTHYQFGGRSHSVDPSIGLLHHYRKGVGIGSILDKTVLIKYGNDITTNVAKAWKEIDGAKAALYW